MMRKISQYLFTGCAVAEAVVVMLMGAAVCGGVQPARKLGARKLGTATY